MRIKDQLIKIKDNWLLLILLLIFLFFFMSGGNLLQNFTRMSYGVSEPMVAGGYREEMDYKSMPVPSEDFAPGIEERKIVHTSRITNEVERGKFFEEETKLKNMVTMAEAYLLNQNVNKYGTDRKAYYTGYYQIKVDTKKYANMVAQLKEIGEVQSFNEDQMDITARYTNTEIEIAIEKERLKRYKAMYEEATEVSDKITLNNNIFNQERKIKYMEDSLKNLEQSVEYSTIYVTLNEKRSEYANIVFVKLSEITRSTVESTNSLVKLVFILLPWALAILIIKFAVNITRKKLS